MSSSLRDFHNQAISYLKQERFLEAIEEFCAEDVMVQEYTNEPTVGRAAMVENEREFLAKVIAHHRFDVLANAIDDYDEGTGVVFYEVVMQWEQSDIGYVTVTQVVVERWRGGKIAHIRFWRNYKFGLLIG